MYSILQQLCDMRSSEINFAFEVLSIVIDRSALAYFFEPPCSLTRTT